MGTQIAVPARKTAARDRNSPARKVTVAGLEIDSKLLIKFSELLQLFHFDVQLVEITSNCNGHPRPVTACVLRLNETAVTRLRNSNCFSPGRTLLYGIGNWSDVAKFSDLGINALLETTSRLSLQNAISSTQPLIGCGIGVHARVPIVTHVTVKAAGMAVKGMVRNLGPGGMAVTLSRSASLPDVVDLDFSLPGTGALSLPAWPRWYSGLLVGLCFALSAETNRVQKWVSAYSELGKQL